MPRPPVTSSRRRTADQRRRIAGLAGSGSWCDKCLGRRRALHYVPDELGGALYLCDAHYEQFLDAWGMRE